MRETARTIVERASILPRGVFFAIGVGAAFGAGIVVAGGIGTAHGTVDTAAHVDTLAQADARAHKLADVKLKLTYADELKRSDPVHVETLPTSSRSKAPAKPAEAEAVPPHLGPPPAAAPVETPRVVDAKPAAAAAVVDGDGDGDGNEDAAPPEKVDDKRIEQALAKVLADHHDAPPALVTTTAPSTTKAYALQVAAAPTRAGAEAEAKKLGATAHVVEGEVGGKPVFRVRLGSYPDRASAEKAKAQLSMPSFIVSE